MSTKKTEGASSTEPTSEGKIFGRYLRDLRKKKGFNQAEIAQMVEITGGYYGFFEQGRQIPSLKIINRLAEVLDADYIQMAMKAGYGESEARKKEIPRSQVTGFTDMGADTADIGTVEAVTADDAGKDPGIENSQRTGTFIGEDNPQVEEAAGGIAQQRIDWTLMCIANDPTYKLAEQFTQGELPNTVKALVIQLYQAQTRRQLLTPEESAALNTMVHG